MYKGRPEGRPLASWTSPKLLDDFDNPVAARLDQDGTAVHHGVAVIARAIFGRHLVIGYAFFRQHRADADVLAVLVGWAPLLDDVAAKARTLLDAQHPGNPADHAANGAADDGAHGTGRALAFPGAAFDTSGDALRLGKLRKCNGCGKGGNSDE